MHITLGYVKIILFVGFIWETGKLFAIKKLGIVQLAQIFGSMILD